MNRPNVLLILSDEHAADIAGFAGDKYVNTANLDALAARSVQFSAATCPSPVCTPSRMCLLTGKEPHNCAAWNNHYILFPEHVTWPQHFASHGYITALIGKMHFGGRDQMNGFQYRPYGDLRHGLGHQPEPLSLFPGYGNPQSGGETEIPESLLSDVVTTRETLAFILEHCDEHPDKPWFVCAGYQRPHAPFTAPGRYVRRYRNKVPAPRAPRHYQDTAEPYARLELDRRYAAVTEEQTRRGVEGYYASVDFLDDCIGELLSGLSRSGSLDNTIVIYTSDHGEMLGRHGLWGKGVYYDAAIQIPLLVSGPGIRSGHHLVEHPISLIDLYPTCCTLAGLPVPEGLDGMDYAAVLADPAARTSPRAFVLSAYYRYAVRTTHHRKPVTEPFPCGAMRLSRRKDWKYVEIEGGDPLLFDLRNDPQEDRSLAADPQYAQLCDEMRAEALSGVTWEEIHRRLQNDRERLPEFFSGLKPTTPNQYMLEDGRVFDAETELYNARWLYIPPEATDGIIPQMFG